MPAVSANAPSSTTTTNSSKPDGADYEPDDEWKLQLRKRIEEGLQSMVADARENQAAELRKSPDTPETRLRLEASYKQAMQTIKGLATEQYQLELDRERNQRRWTAGVPMNPGWTQYFIEEQQNIMNSIKQSSNQTDNSARTVSESPTDERRPVISKPSHEPPTPAPLPVLLPVPPIPSPRPTEEREKSFTSSQSARRGSDARSTLSRDRDEPPGSFRRGHHPSTHERPTLPESWVTPDAVEEPEDILRPAPPRARLSSTDRPSQPSPVSPAKRDSSISRSSGSIHSTDRHLARSPPAGPPPEVWKPAISAAEDALPAKTYKLGRRGSAASMRSTGSGTSMRSTGSGTSIRPSITETIPERADERPDESAIEEDDHERMIEHGRAWISTDKPREKEKRPQHRRNSRPSPVDAILRPDDFPGSSGLRSASSSTMQYATSPVPNGPLLSAKPSLTFVNDDRHYPNDIPAKPPPYHEYRDQASPRDSYQHRDQPQDQPSGRPIPARSSYGGDDRDRDYFSPYSTPHRPHGPKPFTYHPQRESRPISRQTSFTRQPYVDVDVDDDDDDDRDMNRGGGDRDRERPWERDYDRDRDRDGGRDMYSERRGAAYAYSASRHSPYINPPPGGSRPAPQEYVHMNGIYDDRSEGAGPSRDRYNYRNLPPDDWEYPRPPDNARPPPSRQTRPRDDLDRRYSGETDGYSRHYPLAGGIPIPRHTPSIEVQPAWRDWAAEGNRHLNYDYPQQARSPPNVEPFRPFTQPPPSYHNSPHDDHPSFGGRETDPSHRGNSTVTDEYDSDEDENSDEDSDDSESSEDEAKKLRDLEARRQKLEESRREADDELKRTEVEIQRLAAEEARKKREEEEKQKEEEEKRKEEERKEEEAKRREEEAQRKEEEVRRKEEEVKRKEEEAAKKEEEAKRMGEEARKKEEEAKRKEREAKRKEQDAKRKEEAAKRKEEEARQKAEELSRKEEETRKRAAKLEEDAERTKQLQLEAQKIAEDALKKQEDLKKMEEEARKKNMEMKEREDILRRREEELMRREADNFRREAEAKRKEEEAKEREEAKQREEARQREAEEEARQKEAARREEVRREETRKKEEAKRKEEAKKKAEAKKEQERKAEAKREQERKEQERQEEERKEEERKEDERRKAERQKEEVIKEEARKREEARQKDEEAKKKATDAKREEDLHKRKLETEEAKRKASATARESSRREDARLEEFRREQEEQRLQNEHDHILLDPSDPALMEVQYKVLQEAGLRKREEEARKREEDPMFLQQAEFRKREEDIRRTREERKRNDSVGNDNAWSNSSYLSASPGTSPGMSRTPPQFNGPSIPDRSAGPSSWGAGPTPARAPSMKSPAPPSPTANRSSASTSTGKPRTGSVSSGTYPMNTSPHTGSFSEAERTRKQQEFAESQQEQFRRTQEKLEAERQLKSAGRQLSREELQRVFEHHERLWNRLNTLSELSWTDFPWPMAKPPSNPDDMSLPLIGAYIQSPVYPDKDKSRTTKDRIKEHIRRWHPDRFETKLLPRVVEEQREKVKHGAGNVARYLSDLLMKENESNNGIFGD